MSTKLAIEIIELLTSIDGEGTHAIIKKSRHVADDGTIRISGKTR